MKKNNNAFTLIELLITLSVASLLITVAIPFMGSFVANNSAREATSLMELDLLYARNTAVSREVTVEITPVDDEFENGWQIEVIGATDNELLRNRAALDDRVNITSAEFTSSAPVRFNNKGALATAGTITICTEGSTGDLDTEIDLLTSGQTSFRRFSC